MLALSEVIGRPIHFFSITLKCQYLVYRSSRLLTSTPISLVLNNQHFSALLSIDSNINLFFILFNHILFYYISNKNIFLIKLSETKKNCNLALFQQ